VRTVIALVMLLPATLAAQIAVDCPAVSRTTSGARPS